MKSKYHSFVAIMSVFAIILFSSTVYFAIYYIEVLSNKFPGISSYIGLEVLTGGRMSRPVIVFGLLMYFFGLLAKRGRYYEFGITIVGGITWLAPAVFFAITLNSMTNYFYRDSPAMFYICINTIVWTLFSASVLTAIGIYLGLRKARNYALQTTKI